MKREDILSKRTDLSRFCVHLTKKSSTKSAKEILVKILTEKILKASNHHCFFNTKLKNEEDDVKNKFNVVCFTETPLNKIHLMLEVENRKVELEPYGLVFLKSTLKESRGNPVFYVNNENDLMKKYLWGKYDEFIEDLDNGFSNDFFTLGALVNIVKDNHDFHWEREWRIRKRLRFDYDELFAIIAPENEHDVIKNKLNEEIQDIIPFLDPHWNSEEIIENIARQMWLLKN